MTTKKIYSRCRSAVEANIITDDLIDSIKYMAQEALDDIVNVAVRSTPTRTGRHLDDNYLENYRAQEIVESDIAVKIINLLVQAGYKGNPLVQAVMANNLNVVKLLSKNTIYVNQPYGEGFTPILLSAAKDREIVRTLLEAGANVNDQHKSGYTPLMKAIRHGVVDNVRLFLDYHADIALTCIKGQSAIDLANESHNNEIIALIENHLLKKEIEQEHEDTGLNL